MENLFLKILNLSISAAWVVLAVVVLRFVLQKAPKALRVVLWGIVGLRLVWPFSIESILSLIPSAETVPSDIGMAKVPAIHSGVPMLNHSVNPVLAETMAATPQYSVNPMQIVQFIATWVWVIGMGVMALYALISWLVVRWKVREAARDNGRVWVCDRLASPFILGIFCPRIYLPSELAGEDRKYVLDHELAHLKRGDHFWKPLGFLLLTVHWFNPLVWLAYVLLCRDIELACDERVIRELGEEGKKPYSEALINCSVPRRVINACPLAFGETGVKGRVKSVLNYKKPAFWIVLVTVIACVVVAVCFLTDPKQEEASTTPTVASEPVVPPTLWVSDGEGQQIRAVMGNYSWSQITDGKLLRAEQTDADLFGKAKELPVIEILPDLSEHICTGNVLLQFEEAPTHYSVEVRSYDSEGDGTIYAEREKASVLALRRSKTVYVIHAVWSHHGSADYAFVGNASIPEYGDPEAALPGIRQQYPQYFGLDPRAGMTVYVWQNGLNSYSSILLPDSEGEPRLEQWKDKAVNLQTMRAILYSYGVNMADVSVVPVKLPGSDYELTDAYREEVWSLLWDSRNNPWAKQPHWKIDISVTGLVGRQVTLELFNHGQGQYGQMQVSLMGLWSVEQDGYVTPIITDPSDQNTFVENEEMQLPIGQALTIQFDLDTLYGPLPKGEYIVCLLMHDILEDPGAAPPRYPHTDLWSYTVNIVLE